MNRAYEETYVEDAMQVLGSAFEYAKEAYSMGMDQFYEWFVQSEIASEFERGNPKYVSGMSGMELVWQVFKQVGYDGDYVESPDYYDYSCEYWCGWMLAYFQWYYHIDFKSLRYYLSMQELEMLYGILHETSEEKAREVICEFIQKKELKSRLQSLRQSCHLTQSELAKKSSVSLRMIQQYEQGQKDINKASVSSLMAIANALYCDIEDLVEYRFELTPSELS